MNNFASIIQSQILNISKNVYGTNNALVRTQ